MNQALGPSPFPPRHPADSLNSAPPTIYDPYLVPVARPPRPKLSGLAVGSVVAPFLLGPVGSVLAIALGWAARRDIELHRSLRRGHRLATVGVMLGVLSMMAWAAGLVVGVWILMAKAHARPATSAPPPVKEEPVVVAPPSANAPQQRAAPAAPLPPPATPRSPTVDVSPGGSVPRVTTERREGNVLVVDVGVSARSLADELTKQLARAKAAGETMLVMTTRDSCDPCRDVGRSLEHPLLQSALVKVRLVRVDVDVFHEDLDLLKIPRERFPGFYLLAPDLSIRDGIDGGEWDDDIPANIAPILGPFVRGELARRRSPWHPLPGSGIAL